MSTQLICDGCGAPLYRANTVPQPGQLELLISGERVNGAHGAGLPGGRFDWCLPCAQVAFVAVKNLNKRPA